MQLQRKYNLRRNSCEKTACVKVPHLNVFRKNTKSKSINASKDVVVMLEKININLPSLWLNNIKLKKNVLTNSKRLLNSEQCDYHQKKTKRKSCLIPEKQPSLNDITKIVGSKLDSPCEFNKTVLNSDSITCPPENVSTSNQFWNWNELEPIPVVDIVCEDEFLPEFTMNVTIPLINQSKSLQTNSIDTIDLELTPPNSSTSESIVSESSSDSEYTFADFPYLEHLNHEHKNEDLASQDNTLCQPVKVTIVPFEPSLQQLQNLHRRNKRAKIVKVNSHSSFREKRLRPSYSLRQFTPFMIDTPQTSQPKEKHKKSSKKKKRYTHKMCLKKNQRSKEQRFENFVTCQTQLFPNATKQERRQKKQVMKFRNRFENSLASINERMFRQSQFWKMLPS